MKKKDDIEIDVGKNQEMEKKVKKYVKEKNKAVPDKDTTHSDPKQERSYDRNFFIILGIIIGVFVLIFVVYNIIGEKRVLGIEELHEENLKGNLDEDEGYTHKGFSFIKYNDQWWTYFARANTDEVYNVQMRYGPKDVENIPLTGDYVYFLQFNSTYVAFDPTAQNLSYTALAAADISQSLSKVFEIAPFPACTKNETDACKNLQIVDGCPPGIPTIHIVIDDNPEVIAKGHCIVVKGNGLDLVKAVDRLLLGWYGIMP